MKDDRLYLEHVLIHQYMGVDLKRVWNVVDNHLPLLSRAVEDLLES